MEDPKTKTLVLLGSINDIPAILVSEKTVFSADRVAELLKEKVIQDESNDVYHKFFLGAEGAAGSVAKSTLIFPASETV